MHLHQRPSPRICLTSQPLTVLCRCSHPAGSVRVDTLTCREPSAFEQNTGYTTRGCGCGCGRAGTGAGAGASLSAGVLAEAAHKHQAEVAVLKLVQARPYKPLRNPIKLTQEQARSSTGSKYGGEYGCGSQDTTASALRSISDNI